jgi:cytochrome b involved in lipid metabolism
MKYVSVLMILSILFLVGCNSQELVNEEILTEEDSISIIEYDIEHSELVISKDNIISLGELNQHNSESSCWIVFEGNVYDITDYLPRHPGGVGQIVDFCGSPVQFEDNFLKKHGTSKVQLLLSSSVKKGVFE